ncbi:MAG: 2-oxoacid:ferredoxin oxidoreductase subunit beta [Candidatus Marinimicrobia bacterium]|nr:2-oxoacid:ferredoxin oxidoreductase subunit beta [Candidatus Neomarinimicrobiota bacterium]
MNSKELRKKYLREEKTKFCPGCGYEIFINCFLKAVEELGIDFYKTIFVSGIGCAAWIPSPHFKAETLHTTHGRALTFTTGIRLVRPKERIVIISGDGDLATIGGNHLIHSARRNLPMSVFCMNNSIYGMTGGQPSATTPKGTFTSIDPEGSNDCPFDLMNLVLSSGAKFASRYPIAFKEEMTEGIKHNLLAGENQFSFTEIVSVCPTQFGERNNFKSSGEMINKQKEIFVTQEKLWKLVQGKKVFGQFPSLDKYIELERLTR